MSLSAVLSDKVAATPQTSSGSSSRKELLSELTITFTPTFQAYAFLEKVRPVGLSWVPRPWLAASLSSQQLHR